ncbi:MAG: Ig-like domain-containing protein [Kofleriaceae bacterium]
MLRGTTLLISLFAVAASYQASFAEAPRSPKLLVHRLPAQPLAPPAAYSGSTIYLNRCLGGCTVRTGIDDATTDTSSIPRQQSQLPEYTGFQAGEWEATVQCVKEIYSPFDVKIVDARPAPGTVYSEILIGGSPANLGLPPDVGGIAPGSSNCAVVPKGVAFAFASAIDTFGVLSGGSRVHGLCWIIAQETAHVYGLDHEFEFVSDQRSACNDPMTYRSDCGGQKFFRNEFAKCGEDQTRPCQCGGSQNSHSALLTVFGPGLSIVPAPTVAMTSPTAGSSTLAATVTASAGSKRGVAKLELYLNDYKWAEVKGVRFGAQGQANPADYALLVPSQVPNSIVDVKVRAYDDLGNYSETPTVTVTKGAACTSAESCLAGQKCEGGKCFWEPPTGELGADCSYPQFCKSGLCQGTADQPICTQQCILGVADSCPSDFACVDAGGGAGICFFPAEEETGCCSVARDGNVPWAHLGFGTLLLGLLVRPRRRRRGSL